jgi:trk system potassium uptake protein
MHNVLLKVLGLLLVVLGAGMLPSAVVSFLYADGHLTFFLAAAAGGLVPGAGLLLLVPEGRSLRTRDGFLIVALAWFAVSLLGAIPFAIVGDFDLITAIFESASGFTTTGSTAIVGLEQLPPSLLFIDHRLTRHDQGLTARRPPQARQ